MYIITENPYLTAREAIKRSKEMMEGHKAELFLLNLSFIGWGILSLFTCGILLIWLVPYMNAAHANFYKDLKSEMLGNEPAPETAF